MKIIQLLTNWYSFSADGGGEDCECYDIGKKDVVEIIEHKPQGDSDRWFYDVKYNHGGVKRCFNPNSVSFEGEPK